MCFLQNATYRFVETMDISVMQFAFLIIGVILTLFVIFLFFRYQKSYDSYITPLKDQDYFLYGCFFIGFGMMDILHFNANSLRNRKKLGKMREIYGKKYAEYYFFVTVGAKWTYFLTLLPIAFFTGAVFRSVLYLGFVLVAAVLLIYYLDLSAIDKVTERRENLLSELPQVLSKMTLLVNAGMTTKAAWQRVASGRKGILYDEMMTVVYDMQNGMSEVDAYREFSERCVIKEVRKFVGTLLQNMQKGNSEMVFFLKEMADESWEEKKHLVRRKGEIASSKLVIPIGMMLIAILAMIMIPSFASL